LAPELLGYALVQHDDVEGLFLSEVFEVLREEQRPGLVGSHALHQAVDGGEGAEGPRQAIGPDRRGLGW